MAHEAFVNAFSTTLNGSINNSTTSVVLTAAPTGDLSTSGYQWRLLVDSEIMLVTSVSGSTLTVTRGAEGTSGASHSNGATATHILTKASLEQLKADTNNLGTDANLPSVAKAGDTYSPSDEVVRYLYDGSNWNAYGRLMKFSIPPGTGSWTALNSPTSLTGSNGTLLLAVPKSATTNVRGYYKAVPAAPYTITFCFEPISPVATSLQMGFMWYDSASGKIIGVGVYADQGANDGKPVIKLVLTKWTNTTTFSALYNWTHGNSSLHTLSMYQGIYWFRLRDDNANRYVDISADGLSWVQVFSVGRTDFLTPDKVGFFIDNEQNVFGDTYMRVLSWA